MNRKEAIRHLQTWSTTNGSGQTTDAEHEEAKKMAIEALMWQDKILCEVEEIILKGVKEANAK